MKQILQRAQKLVLETYCLHMISTGNTRRTKQNLCRQFLRTEEKFCKLEWTASSTVTIETIVILRACQLAGELACHDEL